MGCARGSGTFLCSENKDTGDTGDVPTGARTGRGISAQSAREDAQGAVAVGFAQFYSYPGFFQH